MASTSTGNTGDAAAAATTPETMGSAELVAALRLVTKIQQSLLATHPELTAELATPANAAPAPGATAAAVLAAAPLQGTAPAAGTSLASVQAGLQGHTTALQAMLTAPTAPPLPEHMRAEYDRALNKAERVGESARDPAVRVFVNALLPVLRESLPLVTHFLMCPNQPVPAQVAARFMGMLTHIAAYVGGATCTLELGEQWDQVQTADWFRFLANYATQLIPASQSAPPDPEGLHYRNVFGSAPAATAASNACNLRNLHNQQTQLQRQKDRSGGSGYRGQGQGSQGGSGGSNSGSGHNASKRHQPSHSGGHGAAGPKFPKTS
jgi:uncharacterized membrane protein YgcG